MFVLIFSNFSLVCLLQSQHKTSKGIKYSILMIWYYFIAFTFASFLIYEEITTNFTVHILNYNSSFLLDNFSFIITKSLHHTSSKLNIVHFPRTLPPGPPLNPLRGSQCPQTPSCVLFPNSCKTQILFPSWLTPWHV